MSKSAIDWDLIFPGHNFQIKRLPIRIHLPNLPAAIQHPVPPYTAEGELGKISLT